MAPLTGTYRKVLSSLLTLLGFSSTFVFESCYGPIPSNYDVDVSSSDLHFPAEGGTGTLEIAADSSWQIERIPEYMFVTPNCGEGMAEVVVEMKANTTALSRCDTLYVLVQQQPAEYIIITQDAVEAEAEEATEDVVTE